MTFRVQPLASPIIQPLPSLLSVWQDFKVGGGGFVTQIVSHTDGSVMCRCDVYGLYLLNRSNMTWQQLNLATNMPASFVGFAANFPDGTWECCFDPQNSSNIWMMYSAHLFKSTVKGANSPGAWVVTNYPTNGNIANNPANGPFSRLYGQKMNVDPNNSNIVIVCDQAFGVYITYDGMNFSSLTSSGIPVAGQGNFNNWILFDPTSGTSSTAQGTQTNISYVMANGNGVYKRDLRVDANWHLMTGSPTLGQCGQMGPDGTIWNVDTNGLLWKLPVGSTTWSSSVPANGFQTGYQQWSYVAVDKTNANHLFVTGNGAYLESHDAGSTWPNGQIFGGNPIPNAVDSPYLAGFPVGYGFQQSPMFDPLNGNLIWASGMQGVWTVPLPLMPQFQGITGDTVTIGTGPKTFHNVSTTTGNLPVIGQGLAFSNGPTSVMEGLLTNIVPNGANHDITINVTFTVGSGSVTVWNCFSFGNNATADTWTTVVAGIEELVGMKIVVPPGGDPILLSWDIACIKKPFANRHIGALDSSWDQIPGHFVTQSVDGDYASSNSQFVMINTGETDQGGWSGTSTNTVNITGPGSYTWPVVTTTSGLLSVLGRPLLMVGSGGGNTVSAYGTITALSPVSASPQSVTLNITFITGTTGSYSSWAGSATDSYDASSFSYGTKGSFVQNNPQLPLDPRVSASGGDVACATPSNVARLLSGGVTAEYLGHIDNGTIGVPGTTLTVTSMIFGNIVPGEPLTGSGVAQGTPGTLIVNQISGTTGGVGTYTVSISQSADGSVNGFQEWTTAGTLFVSNGTTAPNLTWTGIPKIGGHWTAYMGPVANDRDAKHLCVDRVQNLSGFYNFYLWFTGVGCAVSSDGGVTWAFQPNSNNNTGSSNITEFLKLRSVPGNQGHLFLAPGSITPFQGPYPHANMTLWRSIDGGQTFNTVSNVTYTIKETWDVAFGPPKPGGVGYPSVMIYGWISISGGPDVGGFWQSDDNCLTWFQIGPVFPDRTGPNTGWNDFLKSIGGDSNQYGVWYACYNGSGFITYGPQ